MQRCPALKGDSLWAPEQDITQCPLLVGQLEEARGCACAHAAVQVEHPQQGVNGVVWPNMTGELELAVQAPVAMLVGSGAKADQTVCMRQKGKQESSISYVLELQV